MKNNKHSIVNVIKTFEEELKPFYPLEEINGFIRWSFSHICGYSPIDLTMNRNEVLSENNSQQLLTIIDKLKTYEPIQYILGETEFYGIRLKVNPHVLIPRQETEELVDLIIKENQNKYFTILDIGTGSGCIAITLKKHLPKATIIAIDVSNEALQVAKDNARMNNVTIDFRNINILDILQRNTLPSIDIMVSNPPYITQQEKPLMEKNVLDYEPHLALFVPDEDPLLFYKEILDFALEKRSDNSKLYWEINESKAEDLTILLLKQKGIEEFSILKDLSGKNRMMKVVINDK